MTDWFDRLSPFGRLLLLAALVVVIPFGGWLMFNLGRFVGSH